MAHAHHDAHLNLDEQFELTAAARNRMLLAIAIGVVLVIVGIFLVMNQAAHPAEAAAGAHGAVSAHEGAAAHGDEHAFHWTQRLWANLWLNNVWFTGIAVIGVFFVAFNYVAYAGWSAAIIRVPMAFGAFLLVTGPLMLVYFFFGHHDLFHWTHAELIDPASPKFDKIIAGKTWFLSQPFFYGRMIFYFVAWITLWRMIRNVSLAEDLNGGDSYWHRNTVLGAVFLVIFGVTSSTSAWDWLMSLEPHWFSTLFGWYTFASWFVSGLAVITLTVILLKDAGYLAAVNNNHLHDLGKFVFAFSIFWTYLWIAQYLLIYYANLSEETVHFWELFNGYGQIYRPLFMINLGLNFFFPFLFLMKRGAKRTTTFLKIACVVVLSGHFIDFYLAVMPATVGANGGFGAMEVGVFLVYAGSFALVVATMLSKAKLIALHHPMIEESVQHAI